MIHVMITVILKFWVTQTDLGNLVKYGPNVAGLKWKTSSNKDAILLSSKIMALYKY